MAIQTVPRFTVPDATNIARVTGTNGLTSLTASGHRAAWLVRVPHTGTIVKAHVALSASSPNYTAQLRMETLSSNLPSGTLYGGSAAAVLGTNPGATIAIRELSFGQTGQNGSFTGSQQGASATEGDKIAVVLSYSAYTSGNITLNGGSGSSYNFPCGAFYNGTSWSPSADPPIVVLEYSDGSVYEMDTLPGLPEASNSFNVNTAGADEYGNRLRYPLGIRAKGIWVNYNRITTAELVLYDDAGTALSTIASHASMTGVNPGMYLFSSPVTLDANTWYRVTVRPTTTTSGTLAAIANYNAAAMGVLPLGADCYETKRLNQGAFTDVTTRRNHIGLIVDGIETGSGGGTGLQPRIGSSLIGRVML